MMRWLGRLLCAFNFHRAAKDADRRFIWSCLRCLELQAPQMRPLPKAPRYSSDPLAYEKRVDPLRVEAPLFALVDAAAPSIVSFDLLGDPAIRPPEPYEPPSDFGGGESGGDGSSGSWE